MSETKRWAVALIIPFLVSIGGNYLMSLINQAKFEERLIALEASKESRLEVAEKDSEIKRELVVLSQRMDSVNTSVLNLQEYVKGLTGRVNNNEVSIAELSTTLRLITGTSMELKNTVSQLTELVIRMEERERITREYKAP